VSGKEAPHFPGARNGTKCSSRMTLNVTRYERRGAGKVLRTVTRKLESRSTSI